MKNSSLDLFLFIGKLLSIKSKRFANFISYLHLAIILKLKPKCLSIEAVSYEKFEELLLQNRFKFDFYGDIHSCALISINTLAALSMFNKSWLRISKLSTHSNVNQVKEDCSANNEKFVFKIAMPPVKTQESDSKNYFIQCLCVSSAPKDFVLYTNSVTLFNIVNYWNCDNLFCDAVNQVIVEYDKDFEFPGLAKSAVLSGILTESDVSSQLFEAVLDDYFVKPKLLRVGDVIQINSLKCDSGFRSNSNFCNSSDLYFKVITLTGDSKGQEHYVVKGYTTLYLNPPVHSYLPPNRIVYIKGHKQIPGFDIPRCPTGLDNYFNKLKKMFKFIIKDGNFDKMLLLSGSKGSGKKTTLKAVCDFFGLNFFQVNCFDLYGINPSLVEGKLNQISAKARIILPCVIYFKNVELLGRDQNYQENARLIDLFETHIKELYIRKPSFYPVIVVGSTQLKPPEIVPAIARLFIHTVSFEVLKLEETYQALQWLSKSFNMICSPSVLKEVAEKLRGYFYTDLLLLIQHTINIISKETDMADGCNRILHFDHFKKGIEIMEAAYSDSIGAARVPKVLWDDVGGLGDLKEEIMLTLNMPMQHPELFTAGLKRSGVLFYGPPGTGKTLIAKAVATECNYNFLSVKGPELMNMYVGQSEKNVREVFERAREASPCIIFFDELDSLAPRRGKSGDSGGVSDRVASQLLAEMDGLDKNKDIFVIAATNRPDLIDQALLRPGRFDKMFYVGVCKDAFSKLSVLKALTRKFVLSKNVNFRKIIKELPPKVTGADLYSICSNAWFAAARRAVLDIENGAELSLPLKVDHRDFSEAVSQFVPSLRSQDLEYYEKLKSAQM